MRNIFKNEQEAYHEGYTAGCEETERLVNKYFNDRLPSGEPCTKDETAGLGKLNLGRNDPFRKIAVCHDRLYEEIKAGTSDISQDEADKWFADAMLKEAPNHQLGYARAWFRIGVVKLVSMFRRV